MTGEFGFADAVRDAEGSILAVVPMGDETVAVDHRAADGRRLGIAFLPVGAARELAGLLTAAAGRAEAA